MLVWIHGGGFVQGTASQYPMERFTGQGGMVVVSLNYRESRLGFFAHPALAAEAPMIARQLRLHGRHRGAAVGAAQHRRVRRRPGHRDDRGRIRRRRLGARPADLPAGTRPVPPCDRGVSGHAECPRRGGATGESGRRRVQGRRVRPRGGIDGNDAKGLAALRALPAEKVAEEGVDVYAAVAGAAGGPGAAGFSGPIIDGRAVAETFEAALRGGRQAMVPVICGANNVDLAASVAETKDAVFAQFGALASRARELYDPQGDASLKVLKQVVYADRTIVEPTRHLAAAMTRAGQPAYYYRFSYVDEAYRDAVPGVIHGLEMPFTYDIPVSFDGKGVVQLERKGADQEMVRTTAATGPTSCGPVTRTARAFPTGRATTRPPAT